MNKISQNGILICVVLMMGCSGTQPTSIGLTDGVLASCPSRPNCVVSMHGDQTHFIEPFTFQTGKNEAIAALKNILSAQKRTAIVEETSNYLHVEFKTRFFKFVDDVEFYFPEDENVVHIRSASRLGYSDMGLNRKRMESLRGLFMAALENNQPENK